MNWFLVGMWAFAGILNLCVPGEISKLSYGCVWFYLMFRLILDAI